MFLSNLVPMAGRRGMAAARKMKTTRVLDGARA
jgi:hypothetical protein